MNYYFKIKRVKDCEDVPMVCKWQFEPYFEPSNEVLFFD